MIIRRIKSSYYRAFGEESPALKEKYYEQVLIDNEAVRKPLRIGLIIFSVFEISRILASEFALLKGEVRLEEIFSTLAFSILTIGFLIVRSFFKKASGLTQKFLKIGVGIFLLTYCCTISCLLVRRVGFLTSTLSLHRDNFDFTALGLHVIPNIIISDIVFNRLRDKCILPIWEMLTLAVIIIHYQPLNSGALILKIIIYCVYIVSFFWLKERIKFKVFQEREKLEKRTQIYEQTLENVPDNVVIYDLQGQAKIKNEFLKSFEDTLTDKDVLKAVKNIKRRVEFTSAQSLVEKQKGHSSKGYFRVAEELPKFSDAPDRKILNDRTFRDLQELLDTIQRIHSDIPDKDKLIFDGKSELALTGETLSIEIRLSIFDDFEDHSKKQFLVIVRDTTKRDIMATLESNNKFKDNVLASISHEIRTPLNGLSTMIDSCLNDEMVPSKVKKTYILPAARSATLLNHITNYILDYSLLTREKLQMKFERVDINKLLENCYEMIKSHYYKKKIDFRLDIDEQIPQYIRTDPERLTQVILNLLSNAFKFTNQGRILFKAEMDNYDIRITVKDTGIGMKEEARNKLANIFVEGMAGEKIDSSSTGVGLGLTISQAISSMLGPENMSGLSFESVFGSGSTFEFLVENKDAMVSPTINPHKIPRLNLLSRQSASARKELTGKKVLERYATSPTEAQSMSLDEGENRCYQRNFVERDRDSIYLPSYGSRKNTNDIRLEIQSSAEAVELFEADYPEILVVDDEPINLLAFEMISKQLKKPIDKACGGEEALEMIQKKKKASRSVFPKTYKVVFMDLNMPSMDGFETTKRIKEQVRKKEIDDVAIVACTAYLEQDYKQKCLDAGMDDFINKPVTKTKICEILEKYECM